MTDNEARALARQQYADGSDNNIEIDDNAKVAPIGTGITNEAWVQAWVFVRRDDRPEFLRERSTEGRPA